MASSRSACSMGDRTPAPRVARHDARTASTAASCASVSWQAPNARVAGSASSSRSSSSAALRSIADAGLFSS